MHILQIIMLTFHITQVFSRSKKSKYDTSSSDETIENLLYFKDCQKKPIEPVTTTTTHRVLPLRMMQSPPPTPPPQPQCPFPKMCCALSCGNECGGNKEPSILSRQMDSFHNFQNFDPNPLNMEQRSQTTSQIRKRKKLKMPTGKMLAPINGRRDAGFAKAKIKSLISQDDDIRKILKDLVRVTMQKVDLLEMINGNPGTDAPDTEFNETPTTESDNIYDDDYVE